MRVIKNKKKKRSILLRLAVLVFISYIAVILVNQQIQISQKKKELEQLKQEIQIEEVKIEEMKRVAESSDEQNKKYIEQVARVKLELAKRGERVFINIA